VRQILFSPKKKQKKKHNTRLISMATPGIETQKNRPNPTYFTNILSTV